MGLISKGDQVEGLFNASSAESLHIPSESPSEDELPPPAPVPNQHPLKARMPPIPMNFHHLRKCQGKKKARRYQDVNTLMTLVEEDELGEVSINDLAPCHDTHFARLLKDSSSMARWNEFAESSEEAQQLYLMHCDQRYKADRSAGKHGRVVSGLDAYRNIEFRLRAVLRKSKVPLDLISLLEEKITSFFLESPLDVFISENLSTFKRMLLHAISQYHQLFSRSFEAKDDSQNRYVKVVNPHQDFTIPLLSLGDFLSIQRATSCSN